jgi:hypothetical protein
VETKLRAARASANGGRAARGLDAAETLDADLQQDVGLALIEMCGETLRRVDDAVARLVSGAYGECGGEIFQSASKTGFRRGNVLKCPGGQFVSYDWQVKLRSLAGDRDGRCLAFDLQLRPERLRGSRHALQDVASSRPGRRSGQASRVQKFVARVGVVHIRLSVTNRRTL